MSSARLTDPQALDDLLLYRLNRVVSTAGTVVVRLCEGRYGITRREWRALAWLGREEGVADDALARLGEALQAKGLLHRLTGEADRREVRLTLTPAGRALYDELMPQVRAINRELLSVLRPSETQVLDAALGRLQQRAERLAAQSPWPKADRRRGGRGRRVRGGAR